MYESPVISVLSPILFDTSQKAVLISTTRLSNGYDLVR